ncbi:hypothetical protein VFPBJ_06578 [Purpureocillium lilacinum]|uniref:Secreted protein n=1 Tax=Purpureocillium lilacinum TaxID=33203 RepID=A0A179GKP4_PURLI|nr:hypothetical protein VFPBJ_06578 [Purpureocillium lilacinum]
MLASLLLLSSTSGLCKVSSPLRWRAPSPTCAIGGIARVTPVCTPSTQYSAQGARTQTRSGQPGKETISKVHVSRLHFGISVAGMFASSGRRYRPSLTEIPSLAGFSGERRTKMRAKRRNIEKGSQYPLQCPDLLALGFQGPLGLLTRPRRAKPGTPESEPRALGSHMHETVCFPPANGICWRRLRPAPRQKDLPTAGDRCVLISMKRCIWPLCTATTGLRRPGSLSLSSLAACARPAPDDVIRLVERCYGGGLCPGLRRLCRERGRNLQFR